MTTHCAWLRCRTVTTKLHGGLLLSSTAILLSACWGRSYSLGSPGAGASTGGAANGQGSETPAGGTPATAGRDSSGTNDTAGSSGAVSTAGASGTSGHGVRIPANHRTVAIACPAQRGPGSITGPQCDGKPPPCCSSDAQCTSSSGRCIGSGTTYASCTYDDCFSDSDCPATQPTPSNTSPCVCRSSPSDSAANVCALGGKCATDSDCGARGYCSPSRTGCPILTPYFCHTALDVCVDDADCPAVDGGVPSCIFNTQVQRWECNQSHCSNG